MPDIGRLSAFSPCPLTGLLSPEYLDPPIPTSRVEKVDPRATTRPTPALVFVIVLIFNENTKLRGPFINGVICCPLEVRVDNDYHLPMQGLKIEP